MGSCCEVAGGESFIGNRRAAATASIILALASGATWVEVAPDADGVGPLDGLQLGGHDDG